MKYESALFYFHSKNLNYQQDIIILLSPAYRNTVNSNNWVIDTKAKVIFIRF